MKKKFSTWWSFTKNTLLLVGLFLACYACSEDSETKKTYSLLNNIKVVSTTSKSGRVEEARLAITINGVETVARLYQNKTEDFDNDDDDLYQFYKVFAVTGDELPTFFRLAISLLFDKSTGEFASQDIGEDEGEGEGEDEGEGEGEGEDEGEGESVVIVQEGLVAFIRFDLEEGYQQEFGLLSIDLAKAKVNFDSENQTFTMTYQGDATVHSSNRDDIGFVPEQGTSIEIDIEVAVGE